MIVSKANFNLQIFLTFNIAQSATSIDVGSVLREKELIKAVQTISKVFVTMCQVWPIVCFFKQDYKWNSSTMFSGIIWFS